MMMMIFAIHHHYVAVVPVPTQALVLPSLTIPRSTTLTTTTTVTCRKLAIKRQGPSWPTSRRCLQRLYLTSPDNENNAQERDDNSASGGGGGIELELERIQDQLNLIEAIEARNRAQLDSFVDEDDQWNSMDEEEQIFLKSKDTLVKKMELLTEQLVNMWMGQKSMDG